MRRWLLSMLALAALIIANARLITTGSIIDMGTMLDDGADAVDTVPIINVGTDTVAIVKVSTTCGCVKAKIDDPYVAPGDTVWMQVLFMPYGHEGNVHKDVKLLAAPEQASLAIGVEAIVRPSAASIERRYPERVGPLRIGKLALKMAVKARTKMWMIRAYNTSNDSVSINFDKMPDFAYARITPAVMPPHSSGVIEVRADLDKIKGHRLASYKLPCEITTPAPFEFDITLEITQ